MKCPQCESEKIQSFKAIFNQESKSFSSSGTNIATFGIGVNYSEGELTSLLAEKVQPPNKRKNYNKFILGSILILFLFDCFMYVNIITIIKDIIENNLFSIDILNIFCFFAIILLFFYNRNNIKYNKDIYPNLYKKWENSWYCNKCGNEFLNH